MKINLNRVFLLQWRKLSQIAMRVLALFFLTSVFGFSPGNSFSQNLKIKIDADKTFSLIQVFDLIHEQTDYKFVYNHDLFANAPKVELKKGKIPIKDLVEKGLSKIGCTYVFTDNKTLIVKKIPEIPIDKKNTKPVQQLTITGTVEDSNGNPLPGASILIKGSDQGTQTDFDGQFSLEIADENAILQISYLGFVSQEITLEGQSEFTITLQEDTAGLEEVVIVGYGTLQQREVTSAIASVKSDDFLVGSITDPAELIRGQVAGLQINKPGGRSTNNSEISLRGVSTLRSGSSPLIIVDGVPGNLNTVAPEDIESIDILKDGSASAIYGTRGTNGVILITTKKIKSKETKTTVEINSFVSTLQVTKKPDVLNAAEYRAKMKEIGGVYGTDEGYSTDWQDIVLKANPLTYSNNLSLRSGTEEANFILNVNHKDISGIIKTDDTKILNTRLEGNYSMFDGIVKLNANILGRKQKTKGGDFENAYFYSTIYNPTDRPKDDSGNWTHRPLNNYSNPLMILNEVKNQNQNDMLRLFGTLTVNPTEDLSAKILVSNDVNTWLNGWAHTKKHESTTKNNLNAQAGRSAGRAVTELIETTLEYKKVFGAHKLNVVAGHSWQNFIYEDFEANNRDFPSDGVLYNDLGAGKGLLDGEATMRSNKYGNKLAAYFIRVNYNFDYRYMLMLSMRREGSSKFGSNNKWGNFPGISVGWNIKNEQFLKSVDFLSFAKLRAGFGITGTLPRDNYAHLARMSFGQKIFINGEWIPGMAPSSNPNPNLQWETKQEYNIGMDIGFWNNRLALGLDYYKRITNDILWDYPVPSPPYVYTSILANVGTMINNGVEMKLTAIPIKNKEANYTTSVLFSSNNNKLTNLSKGEFQNADGYINMGHTGEPIQTYLFRLQEDGPVGDFYGYKSIDIDENGFWIVESESGTPIPLSEAKESDKKVIGNGSPKYFLNWNNNFTYKQFDLGIYMRAVLGFDILNFPDMFTGVPVGMSRGNVLKHAFEPRLNGKALSVNQNQAYVSEFVQDGSYVRLDNITLGYTFNSISDIVKRARIYLNGSNVLTFTNYKGLDPEVGISGLQPGVDHRFRYPQVRTVTLGVQLTF